MTRASTWLNADGLLVPFGTSDGKQAEAATIHTKGMVKELRLDLDYTNLPNTGSAVQGNNIAIPNGASILSAKWHPTTTFSHAVEVGTMTSAGVNVDKDGLIATSTLATGSVTVGAGAQVNTVASQDLYVTVRATTTTPTAGAGTLVIEYQI